MAPAKATRPGFRQSLAAGYSDSKADVPTINLFHPVYHSFTCPIGSRIDVDRLWPVHLKEVDTEELIDTFSEPPQFLERMSPVSVQLGEHVIGARNWTELMVKVYRYAFHLFEGIGGFIDSRMRQGRIGVGKVSFTSFAIDPDTLHRIIEMDYETGESSYAQIMRLFGEGTVSPCLTTPFHTLLPTMSDCEIRLCVRVAFVFYERIVQKYREFLKKQNEDGLMVIPFWAPETAFHGRVEQILREEFAQFCKRSKLGRAHLVLLLDNDQTDHEERDVLMKSWNLLERTGKSVDNGSNGSRRHRDNGSVHPAIDETSVVFRDRHFSEWAVYANPSVKKLLDRTIAKVDSDLNRQEIHYGWAHYEELESLAHTPKSVLNFRQKLVKLTELGYVPLSPDFYIRGKLRGQLGYAVDEPRRVRICENSAGPDWVANSGSFARWQGLQNLDGTGRQRVIEDRKYVRNTTDGVVEEEGKQCWKIGWSRARRTCAGRIVGDLETGKGGMAEILAGFAGGRSAQQRADNVMEFLTQYTYVYWREHFIQHDLSEADINIHEIANETLRNGVKSKLSEIEAAICGAAAQAIYFAMDSDRSTGTRYENMDQRAFYQNVVMLTLAACNAVYVYHWMKDVKSARKMVDLIKEELIGFEGAWKKYKLADYGVTAQCWADALKPHVMDSTENVVARAAGRVAATHLRPLGYTRDFSRDDELKSVNVGHLWSTELKNLNYTYENPLFCGVREA